MKRIVVSILIAMMVFGAVFGAAAAISLGGVDRLLGDSSITSITTGVTPSCTMVGITCTVVAP